MCAPKSRPAACAASLTGRSPRGNFAASGLQFPRHGVPGAHNTTQPHTRLCAPRRASPPPPPGCIAGRKCANARIYQASHHQLARPQNQISPHINSNSTPSVSKSSNQRSPRTKSHHIKRRTVRERVLPPKVEHEGFEADRDGNVERCGTRMCALPRRRSQTIYETQAHTTMYLR